MGIIVISIYRGFIKKMKVWNLDVIWQCWSYLQICVFVSNIGSVHYLEMPASLWGGTVSAPFIPHSFNGGSKSHISREQDFSPLSIFKSIFTVSTEAAKVTFRERLQNLTTEILLLAPSESCRSLFKLSLFEECAVTFGEKFTLLTPVQWPFHHTYTLSKEVL